MKIRWLYLTALVCGLSFNSSAFEIRGKVNLNEEWQPNIYLASVHHLGDYYRASPDLILSISPIDEKGEFVIQGDYLPEDDRLYRLYLMKEQNSEYDACIYVGGDDHNFIHLILNKNSNVQITTDPKFFSPFGNYQVSDGPANNALRKLAKIVYPSFYFYQIRFPAELKFSQDKLHQDLKRFIDTTEYILPGLAAIQNIDLEKHFYDDPNFFLDFQQRVESSDCPEVYKRDYARMMWYYQGDKTEVEYLNTWSWVFLGLWLLTLFLWWMDRKKSLRLKQRGYTSKLHLLTPQEKTILEAIKEGQSNKEIANQLFIEVSTVKSHINKIYNKLGIRGRQDVLVN